MKNAVLFLGAAAGLAAFALWYSNSEQASTVPDAPQDTPVDTSIGLIDSLQASFYGMVGFDMTDPNIQAFLNMIRAAEGTTGDAGYRTLFGGGLFVSYADHPRIGVKARSGSGFITSTAAGAYQILAGTWDGIKGKLNLPDFSPASQDVAAVELIRRRGALGDVTAGRFGSAVKKCAKEWASMPGSPYGQPTISWGKAAALFADNGGTITDGGSYA